MFVTVAQVLTNFEPVKLRSASKFFIPAMSKIFQQGKGKKKASTRYTTFYKNPFLEYTNEKIFQLVDLVNLVNVFNMLLSFIINMLK